MDIAIYFDIINPWFYIGKRRLESALRQLSGRVAADVRWLAFELNPQMPPEGMSRRAYRTARCGGWEQAVALDAQVADAGSCEGLVFAFERIERTPNTLDAHRLIALARRAGAQDAVVEAIFRAYYTEGRDIGQRATLLEIATAAGLESARGVTLLESDEGTALVRADEANARLLGVPVVPHFHLNGAHAVCCAWSADTIAAALETAERHAATTRADVHLNLGVSRDSANSRALHGFSRTACGCDFCRAYCKHAPGLLDVADLAMLGPPGPDLFAWAEQHLRAVLDKPYPKLVPARQANGHCHWYANGKCAVHEVSPYGCAFFDAHMPPSEVERRSLATTQASREDAARDGIYVRVWRHLRDLGLTSPSSDRAALDADVRRIQLSMELN